ncbi:putative defensin-like protein 307 [Raphanus sativus]|uniref:Defensin-like protein 307 n=1 Tax=Raphanus sativus TaxID=3726 RepID=A0A6J0LLH2_RAPSA|nr:putative defensin-like protein 307 [Raphanus sativus]XP_056864936.1 putative defensin-like protein 307 [Raphanus sativus]
MEKTALIFIGILLFSACTPILARKCKKNSDCASVTCPSAPPVCFYGDCECPPDHNRALPDDTNCGVAACSDYCKAKGEVPFACLLNHCYCRKPPM